MSDARARKDLDKRIGDLEFYVDEVCTENGPRRSSALGSLARLREEREALDRNQDETIAAVLAFARALATELPERLRPFANDDETTAYAKSNRTLERERVAAELEALLEEAGVDVTDRE